MSTTNSYNGDQQHPLFPVRSCDDVVSLFLETKDEPDLTLLSLLLGLIEHQFTANYSPLACDASLEAAFFEASSDEPLPFHIPRPKSLLDQFRTLVRGSIDLSQFNELDSDPYQRTQLVERVADTIWSHLSPASSSPAVGTHTNLRKDGSDDVKGGSSSSKDVSSSNQQQHQAHLQFLSSFILERKLDSFGLTFAVLAALQILFPKTYHKYFFLSLSEDHSWISVRTNNDLSSTSLNANNFVRVEVTWHGKKEDMRQRNFFIRRYLSNSSNSSSNKYQLDQPDNWLYLNGNAVTCLKPYMAVAALASALNPSITPSHESLPLARLQRDLLLAFHSAGCLSKYPLALANLADLQELLPPNIGGHHDKDSSNIVIMTMPQPQVLAFYRQSVASVLAYYDNSHIYPYTYLAGYYFRNFRFGDALSAWKEASHVVSRYNFNPRDDEEAYKEFQGIANDLIPYTIKRLSDSSCLSGDNYRDLLEFYDGLCQWEQGSKYPLLHIGWAKSFISCLNKFPVEVRTRIQVLAPIDGQDQVQAGNVMDTAKEDHHHDDNENDDDVEEGLSSSSAMTRARTSSMSSRQSRVRTSSTSKKTTATTTTEVLLDMKQLASKCGESLLNRAFLLGHSDQPLLSSSQCPLSDNTVSSAAAVQPQLSPLAVANDVTADSTNVEDGGQEVVTSTLTSIKCSSPNTKETTRPSLDGVKETIALTLGEEQKLRLKERQEEDHQVTCRLASNKMTALKDLLTSSRNKLNASAIQLQITAQSSLFVSQRPRGSGHPTSLVIHHYGTQSSSLDYVTSSTTVPTDNGQRPKRQRT